MDELQRGLMANWHADAWATYAPLEVDHLNTRVYQTSVTVLGRSSR